MNWRMVDGRRMPAYTLISPTVSRRLTWARIKSSDDWYITEEVLWTNTTTEYIIWTETINTRQMELSKVYMLAMADTFWEYIMNEIHRLPVSVLYGVGSTFGTLVLSAAEKNKVRSHLYHEPFLSKHLAHPAKKSYVYCLNWTRKYWIGTDAWRP